MRGGGEGRSGVILVMVTLGQSGHHVIHLSMVPVIGKQFHILAKKPISTTMKIFISIRQTLSENL